MDAKQAHVIALNAQKKKESEQLEYVLNWIKINAELGAFSCTFNEILYDNVVKELKEKGFKIKNEFTGVAGKTNIYWKKIVNKKGRKLLPLPKPKKVLKRGLYELMWGAKPRDYGERCSPRDGKKKNR